MNVETFLHHNADEFRPGIGQLECLLSLQALLDEVELIAQGLKAVRHTDLGHVGLADVVALWTLLQVVMTQEVDLLLGHRRKQQACFGASIISDLRAVCVVWGYDPCVFLTISHESL